MNDYEIQEYIEKKFFQMQDKDVSQTTLNTINKWIDSPHLVQDMFGYWEKDNFFSEFEEYLKDKKKITKKNMSEIKARMALSEKFDNKKISTLAKDGKKADLKENMLYDSKACMYYLLNTPNQDITLNELKIAEAVLSKNEAKSKENVKHLIKTYKEIVGYIDIKNERLAQDHMIDLNEGYYQLQQSIMEEFREGALWNSDVERRRNEDHAAFLYTAEKVNKKELNEQMEKLKYLYSRPKNFEKIRDLIQREIQNNDIERIPKKTLKKEHKEYLSKLEKFIEAQKPENRVVIAENTGIKNIYGLKDSFNYYMRLFSEGKYQEAYEIKNKIIVGAEYLIDKEKGIERKNKEPAISNEPFKKLIKEITIYNNTVYENHREEKEAKQKIYEVLNEFEETVSQEVLQTDWDRTYKDTEVRKYEDFTVNANNYLYLIRDECENVVNNIKDNVTKEKSQKRVCAYIEHFKEDEWKGKHFILSKAQEIIENSRQRKPQTYDEEREQILRGGR